MQTQPLSRRHFLRSAGVAIGLPYLESIGWKAFAAPLAEPARPQRFAFIYTPNGYYQKTFMPAQTGKEWELPEALQPLAKVRDQVTLVSGLDRVFVPGTGVHAQCGSCWLTSSPPQETLDGGFPTNRTLDQILAEQIGKTTPLASLELSTNDHTDNRETKYFECISWYGPGYAANTEKDPRAVFRRLFGQGKGDPTRRSILDTVLADAKSLHARLGKTDQIKLDEYLTSVRETEARIQYAEAAMERIQKTPLPEPASAPRQRGEYIRLMGDLILHAFELDLTRVATLVIDPERWDSPRMYDGVFDAPQNHHVLTHTKGEEAKTKLTQIDRFHVQQFAYLVEKMNALSEGTGSLLDHTTLVMGSGISDGDSHNYADLQVLMAGGQIQHGHFHYQGKRPLADLWLTLARQAGVSLDRFADSGAELPEVINL